MYQAGRLLFKRKIKEKEIIVPAALMISSFGSFVFWLGTQSHAWRMRNLETGYFCFLAAIVCFSFYHFRNRMSLLQHTLICSILVLFWMIPYVNVNTHVFNSPSEANKKDFGFLIEYVESYTKKGYLVYADDIQPAFLRKLISPPQKKIPSEKKILYLHQKGKAFNNLIQKRINSCVFENDLWVILSSESGDNNNQLFLDKLNQEIHITSNNCITNATFLTGDNKFVLKGKKSQLLFNRYISVQDKLYKLTAKVKNCGDNPTQILFGLVPYTRNFNGVGSQNYPYKTTKTLRVISSEKNSNSIRVDSYPEWKPGSYLALNAKDDLSDIPNYYFAEGSIKHISKNQDGSAEIKFITPLKEAFAKGSKVRIHNSPNDYIITNDIILQSGEENIIEALVPVDDKSIVFSSQAIPKGVDYIRPFLFSNSVDSSQDNIIEVIDFTISCLERPDDTLQKNASSLSSSSMIPTDIPVADPEEAKESSKNINSINEIEQKEKTEPFYRLYAVEDKENRIDKITFEGTVRSSSIIPDPKKNDYPDCLYALLIEIDSVLSNPSNVEIEHEVIVDIPVMKNKTIIEANKYLPGDKIKCVCAEYDKLPQEIQRIQISDDIQSFEHQQFYALNSDRVFEFHSTGNKNFSKRKIAVLPIKSLSKDENAKALRSNRIRFEIKRIEEELKLHGGSFEAWKTEYKPIAEKYKQLCDDNFRAWINDSYYVAYGEETEYQTMAYIKGLLPYKKYLEENNIDLIILRIPSKGDFAARVLASDDFQENPAWIEHYLECLKNDIEIVDPMPEMYKHRFDFPLFYFFHPESEFHPFEGQAYFSAKVLSDVLRRYSFATSNDAIELRDYSYNTDEPRYFWPEGNVKYNPKENIVFKEVIQNNKTIGNLSVNSGSPFLFLSNSFFWFPRATQGASVPGYTAFFLQHIPDWFYQDGTRSNPLIRMLCNSPESLQKRRAVIMVGHPKNWNGAFPSFPKYLLDNPQSITLEKTIDFFSPEIVNHDDGSFLFTKDEKGIIQISRNQQKKDSKRQFDIELSIPEYKEKSTCMLRINFEKTTFLSIRVLDAENNTQIDTASLSLQNDITPLDFSPSFYIPASTSRKIIIRFSSTRPFALKNIELWYY